LAAMETFGTIHWVGLRDGAIVRMQRTLPGRRAPSACRFGSAGSPTSTSTRAHDILDPYIFDVDLGEPAEAGTEAAPAQAARRIGGSAGDDPSLPLPAGPGPHRRGRRSRDDGSFLLEVRLEKEK